MTEPKLAPPAKDGRDYDESPRCPSCGKLLAVYLTRPWKIVCTRCKTASVRLNPNLTATNNR